MKRSILFGAASFFVLGIIGFAVRAFTEPQPLQTIWIVGIIFFMVTSIPIVRAAKSAPMHKSRGRAVAGWTIGFAGSYLALLVLLGALYVGVVLLFGER